MDDLITYLKGRFFRTEKQVRIISEVLVMEWHGIRGRRTSVWEGYVTGVFLKFYRN